MIPAFVLQWHRPLASQSLSSGVHVATASAANFILFLENGACNEVNIHNTLASFSN